MKITIQKREPDKNGHRALRLVYYHGSKTGQNGSRAQKRSYEPLNLFLYDKPRLPAEREHNKTVNQKAEAIRAKRLLEIESSRHGLDDRTKLSASFFDYFDQLTDEKASGSKSNHSIWISTRHHLHRYHGLSELTFEQVDKRFLEGSGITFSMKPLPNPVPNWPRTRPAVTSTRFGQRSTKPIGMALSATTRFNRSSPSNRRTPNERI